MSSIWAFHFGEQAKDGFMLLLRQLVYQKSWWMDLQRIWIASLRNTWAITIARKKRWFVLAVDSAGVSPRVVVHKDGSVEGNNCFLHKGVYNQTNVYSWFAGVGGYCVACLKRSNYIKLNIDELMPLPGELNSCECRENCRQCENWVARACIAHSGILLVAVAKYFLPTMTSWG